MKSIFKFLGLAMMATALTFAACSKDEDNVIDNQQQGNQDPTPGPGQDTIPGYRDTTSYSNRPEPGVLASAKLYSVLAVGNDTVWTIYEYYTDDCTFRKINDSVFYVRIRAYEAQIDSIGQKFNRFPAISLKCELVNRRGEYHITRYGCDYFYSVADCERVAISRYGGGDLAADWSCIGDAAYQFINFSAPGSRSTSDFTMQFGAAVMSNYDYYVLNNHETPSLGLFAVSVKDLPLKYTSSLEF
ncbi:MAG: hypothetical protein KBT04_07835 [Bacteroidales bacterium]|nr:hypothetical protein [Candidatus Colimorpha onthohippi]